MIHYPRRHRRRSRRSHERILAVARRFVRRLPRRSSARRSHEATVVAVAVVAASVLSHERVHRRDGTARRVGGVRPSVAARTRDARTKGRGYFGFSKIRMDAIKSTYTVCKKRHHEWIGFCIQIFKSRGAAVDVLARKMTDEFRRRAAHLAARRGYKSKSRAKRTASIRSCSARASRRHPRLRERARTTRARTASNEFACSPDLDTSPIARIGDVDFERVAGVFGDERARGRENERRSFTASGARAKAWLGNARRR